MAEITPWLLLVTLASLIMNSIIISLIFSKSEQASNRVTWILLSATFALFIWIITSYIQLDLVTIDDDPFRFAVIAALGNLSNLIVQIFLVNFFRLLIEPRVSWIRNAYLCSLGALLCGFAFVAIYAGWDNDTDLIEVCWAFADTINLIFTPSVVIFAGLDLRTLLNESMSEKQHKQVTSLRNGLIFGLVGILPFLVLQRVDHNYLAVILLIITIALFFFIRAYLVDPRVAFIVPHRAYLAIVVNKTGVLKYSKNFLDESSVSDSTVLVSAGLSAINSMMSEFYETEVRPTFLAFEEKKILFHWSEDYFIAVFADRDSMLLRLAMKQTTKEIKDKYKEEIRDMMDGLRMLDELDEIIARTFYFIYQ
ncbi:MAG: hypothetical protein ACFFCQ_15655 [Promethearchaeota archaeon]